MSAISGTAHHHPTSEEARKMQKKKLKSHNNWGSFYAIILSAGLVLAVVSPLVALNLPKNLPSHIANIPYEVMTLGGILFTIGAGLLLRRDGYRNSALITAVIGFAVLLGSAAGFEHVNHLYANQAIFYVACGLAGLAFIGAMIKLAKDAYKTWDLMNNAFLKKDYEKVIEMLQADPQLLQERHNVVFSAKDEKYCMNATLLELALYDFSEKSEESEKTAHMCLRLIEYILEKDPAQKSRPNAIGVTPDQMVEKIADRRLTNLWNPLPLRLSSGTKG